ncbi:cobalt-precorrin-5B (C1)-methyltransferase [Desulfocicer vacuolatum DSM 3385]|uniref:Cobalt-precorrin-5B C(1)-methyltransferase n=1 Tax=Desulfocicer vacuolatum DSM 3385 TaxID=1121400 RepID=A0A1W2C8Q5_9BACT|nr:cobalt-precorrin-5B (C(1))-methyltransferase CbiD [Desulfocicer vacuolatum]SMC81521.1 cobalt-precorrin-5B (C1)-methyltransferase [Desulfocicer vacuolatum DSM 3385]
MTQKKKLKKGVTTGACAAAATKAALHHLLFKETLNPVNIQSLTHDPISVAVHGMEVLGNNEVSCVVIKDAGDDPDVTHKAHIGARVQWCTNTRETTAPMSYKDISIEIRGGKGVGTVTKPGLEVLPGNPAINSGPVKMIHQAVNRVMTLFEERCCTHGNGAADEAGKKEAFGHETPLPEKIIVEVFVPEGEKLAEKTLNSRLGIMGGISILGTTGIVKPMSHDAYIATINSGISVAEAMGDDTLVFTTGRRSERFAMDLFPHLRDEAFIQTGDFFKASLDAASGSLNIRRVIITVFFGKAVKMAMGFPHTHAAKSELTMKKLALWAKEITGNDDLSRKIAHANTARHAFTYIHPDFPELISHVGKMIIKSAEKFSQKKLTIDAVIFDFEGNRVFDSMS